MAVLEPNDSFQDRGLIKITDGIRTAEINSSNELLVTQGSLTGAIDGLNETFEDTSFVAGDSPVVLDFNAAAGRNALDGYIINDGPGDFTVEFSRDGATYGGAWTMKEFETMSLRNYDVDSIRITHGGTDSAYRVNLI
jgi:hypothetical protein